MSEIFFSSVLKPEQRENLESLLFFNPLQRTIESSILKSLDHFGPPEISSDNGKLNIRVRELPDLQTLFAFERSGEGDRELIGAILYFRTDSAKITVLHVAVREDYCVFRKPGRMLVRALLSELRRIARLIKGVEWITTSYTGRTIRV
ncbi:MAG: hypothetical protein ACE5JX_00765 [Acidobacteriota bacterium]